MSCPQRARIEGVCTCDPAEIFRGIENTIQQHRIVATTWGTTWQMEEAMGRKLVQAAGGGFRIGGTKVALV
ncbi:hypothetical protein Hanom_Chr07g00671041 [Helianthus anomalus]